MSGKSKIEWCDVVWNPVVGCSKVSEGCRHCYAEAMAKRLKAMGRPEYQDVVDEKGWTGKVASSEKWDKTVRKWKKPRRIFVNSMSDLFLEDVPFGYILSIFYTMALHERHTFMILTKRPDRMRRFFEYWIEDNERRELALKPFLAPPIKNVWMGVSVEDQKTADERIPLLMKTPAAVRFVSYEPALGPVDLHLLRDKPCSHPGCFHHVSHPCEGCGYQNGRLPIDWVICGGESGPGARPMHPEWARSVRDQCQAAGVPFFFKQWGEWQHVIDNHEPGRSLYERVGRKAAGRLLDGREWSELPNPQPLP